MKSLAGIALLAAWLLVGIGSPGMLTPPKAILRSKGIRP